MSWLIRSALLVFALTATLSQTAQAQSFTASASVSGPAITMTWTPVSGATSYVVDAGVAPGNYTASNLPATSTGFTVSAPFVGTFYLRARALSGATLVAASNEVQVTVTSLVAPPANVEAFSYCGGVLLRWSSGGGSPSGYRVDVTGAATASFTTTRTEFHAPVAPAGAYAFTVTALSGANQSTPSSVVPFTVGGPTQTVPTPVITPVVYGRFVRARWTPVPGVSGYALEALRNGVPILSTAMPASVSAIQATGVDLASYTLRVSAAASCGAQSVAGESAFTVDGAPPAGPRTANPAPGQRLPLPSYGAAVVRALADERPDLVYASCLEHGGNNRFMFEAVRRLRQQDTRWGLNWKRGNRGDLSQDIVTYNFGSQSDEDTTDVYIIDIISGHCGNAPTWNFQDQTGATAAAGAIGRWTLLPYIEAGYTP